ncbi:MAG TPA: hypothetical protein VKB51_00700 [bacterium]|nr:hypothetical protein [bacterium]
MIERDLLLNSTAAILLGTLAWHYPALRRSWGRRGFALYVLGTLLPFLDTAVQHVTTDDRIGFLSAQPLFQAPLYGLALIGALAVLVGFALSPRPALAMALGLGAGYAAHVVLSLLTPAGWPLLAPWTAERIALPILPAGHVLLLLVLFPLLIATEALPRWRRWIAPAAGVLAGAYLLAGAVQWGIVTYRVRGLATPETTVGVYPAGPWLARWLVVEEGPERYQLRRMYALTDPLPGPETMPRWNDEPLFLKLLGDPVVSRFYFRVFHHPVVRLDVSGAQITLLMQEVQDQTPLVPGPTFYLESDLSGRNRFYQLQRFD